MNGKSAYFPTTRYRFTPFTSIAAATKIGEHTQNTPNGSTFSFIRHNKTTTYLIIDLALVATGAGKRESCIFLTFRVALFISIPYWLARFRAVLAFRDRREGSGTKRALENN